MSYKVFFILLASIMGGISLFIINPQIGSVPNTTQSIPCDKPLTYQFGSIDSRFDITKKELTNIMRKVETLWATALDRQLLTYNKKGTVTINLIYSDNQKQTEVAKRFYRRIQIKKKQRKIREKEYQRLKKEYVNQRKELSHMLSKSKQLIDDYKALLSKWSKRGDIPKFEKQKLKKKQHFIRIQKQKLDHQRGIEESMRKRINQKTDRLNALVKEENGLVKEYNRKYGEPKKFNQGKYTKVDGRESINIYQFANAAELKTVLAHEAGHALGLPHLNNASSIMFWMMGKQNIFDLKLSKEDIAAIKNRCH